MSNSQMRKKTNKKGSVTNGTFSTSTSVSLLDEKMRGHIYMQSGVH